MRHITIISVCLILIMVVFSSCMTSEEEGTSSTTVDASSGVSSEGSSSAASEPEQGSDTNPEPEVIVTQDEVSLFDSEGEKIEFPDTAGNYSTLSLAENRRAKTFNGTRLGDVGGDAAMAYDLLISKVEAFSKHSYYSDEYKQEEEKLKQFNFELNRKFYNEYYNPYAEIMKADKAGFIIKFEVIVVEDDGVLKALRKSDTKKLYGQSGSLSEESIQLLRDINDKTRYILTIEVTDSELTDLTISYKK